MNEASVQPLHRSVRSRRFPETAQGEWQHQGQHDTGKQIRVSASCGANSDYMRDPHTGLGRSRQGVWDSRLRNSRQLGRLVIILLKGQNHALGLRIDGRVAFSGRDFT